MEPQLALSGPLVPSVLRNASMLVESCEVSPSTTCAHPSSPLCGIRGLGEKLDPLLYEKASLFQA